MPSREQVQKAGDKLKAIAAKAKEKPMPDKVLKVYAIDDDLQAWMCSGIPVSMTPNQQPPDWIQIFPFGEYYNTNSKTLENMTEEDADWAIRAKAEIEKDIVTDYEHQTLFSAQNGEEAPAACWFKELQKRTDGLWGRVIWTERAAKLVTAKPGFAPEYGYFSPVYFRNAKRENGKVYPFSLGPCALVNDPCISNIKPILNKAFFGSTEKEPQNPIQEVKTMIGENAKKLLCAMLKCKDGASDEEIETAAKAVMDLHSAKLPGAISRYHKGLEEQPGDEEAAAKAAKAMSDGLANICKAVGLPENSDPVKVEGAILNLKGTTEQVKHTDAEMIAAKARIAELEGNQFMAKATGEGKITATNKDFFEKLSKRDLKTAEEVLAITPVFAKAGPVEKPDGAKEEGKVALTETQKAVINGIRDPKQRERIEKQLLEGGK